MNFSREKSYCHYSYILCFIKVSTDVKQQIKRKKIVLHYKTCRICYSSVTWFASLCLSWSFIVMFVLVELINGYVKNLTAVSPSRGQKRKYFQFTLQTKGERRVVSFSPEKHKLLSKIRVQCKPHWKCSEKWTAN